MVVTSYFWVRGQVFHSFTYSGKTSLLFQHALACCRSGGRVLFVCPKPMEMKPLYRISLHEAEDIPMHVLERLHFRYNHSFCPVGVSHGCG